MICKRSQDVAGRDRSREGQSESEVLGEPGEITIRSQLGSFLRFGLKAGPTLDAGHIESELVEQAADDVIDDVVDA